MARAGEGWTNTTKNDRVQEFCTSNVLKRPIYEKKVYFDYNYLHKIYFILILGSTVTTFANEL
jgi:hypothetical protein